MAGRRGRTPRPTTFVQTPGVDDPKTQRALDTLASAVQGLQARAPGGATPDVFTATADGLAPASGGSASDFLAADGTWKSITGAGLVDSVTAGSSKVSVSPNVGAVIVDVVPANFTGIPQSGVSGLVADLAAITGDIAAIEGDISTINTTLAGVITGVTAGTNLSGGGSSGDVTLNVVGNPTFSTSVTVSTLTAGSVIFAGTAGILSQDNSNLFWDDTNNRLGIGTNSPARTLAIVGADSGTHTATIQNTQSNGYSAIDFLDNSGTAKIGIGYSNVDTRGYLALGNNANLIWSGNTTTRGTFFNNGRVNIGATTTDPGVLLRVEGDTTCGVSGGSNVHTRYGVTEITVGTGVAPLRLKQTSGSWYTHMEVFDGSGNYQTSFGYAGSTGDWLASNPFIFTPQTGKVLNFSSPTKNNAAISLTDDSAYLMLAKGDSAAVSASNTGRIRYNQASQIFQTSLHGGAYATLPQGSGTSGRSARWTAAGVLGTGAVLDDGTNLQTANDDSHFGWDTNGSNPRIGFTKKSGAVGKLTYGSGNSFAIAQSSAANILASGTFTDRLTIDSSGNTTIGVAGSGDVTIGRIISVTTPNSTIPVIRSGRASASTVWGVGHSQYDTDFSFNYFNGTTWAEDLVQISSSGNVTLGGTLTVVGNSGFNGTSPIAKPTVTGSRGGNAALQSLLTALANYGLITDSSS